MMRVAWKWKMNCLLSRSFVFVPFLVIFLVSVNLVESMTRERKNQLKNDAREMFYHAYNSYMENAFPADELMPLTCKGRYRGVDTSRGDIDDALGNFTLTLVDSLDTLVVLGDFDEFERAVKLVIREVRFDSDVLISVFETNIRMMGGLLSAHVLSGFLQENYPPHMNWYKGELLNMALDLGYRLLPAFNTTTGIPYSRVNLKTGIKSPRILHSKETCTACAGTMILEFAALSRLSGDPVFEEKAHKAMDALWSFRHRSSDLMGTVLNVHSGDWVRRDAGVGAGIDSYYEYCLKAYVLLGDERYLDRFNRHYSAVMKYVSQGPLLLDVHMHRPHTNSKNFMDALLAFWPGLQVLKGDLKPAVETHEMLYQVIQRHNFLPEAFTTDFQVHWGQHPLRPEFVESSYFLYKATGDDYYLEAGAKVLNSLQQYARVPCGFAAVKDVRTSQHEDRMDSFVLAETFKYLYLLFSEPEELPLTIDDFVFTTEAHLLPLSLARLSNLTAVPLKSESPEPEDADVEQSRSCPSSHYLFPGQKGYAETIREPLKNMVDRAQPVRKNISRKLRALDFQAGNADHIRLLRDMGITIIGLPDGRVQLLHSYSSAKTSDDAEEGLLFMQEMVEISKSLSSQPENPPRTVSFRKKDGNHLVVLKAGPAQFGAELVGDVKVTAGVVIGEPYRMCSDPVNSEALRQKIVVMERGDCMFIEKARRIQRSGAVGGIIVDNVVSSSSDAAPLFAMSGDGKEDVRIPMVFLYSADAGILHEALQDHVDLQVTLAESVPEQAEISPSELRIDDSAAQLPVTRPEDAAVEKLRSEVKRIVLDKMKEERNKETHHVEDEKTLARASYIIRMDDSGAIVTEAIDSDSGREESSSFTDDPDDRRYLTLLKMVLQFLLSVRQEDDLQLQAAPVDLEKMSPSEKAVTEEVFRSHGVDIDTGLPRAYVEDLLASFRLLWPGSVLPNSYFDELEKVLMLLARDSSAREKWGKQQNDRLMDFLRSVRSEFGQQLRGSRNGKQPIRTPDEL